MAAKKRQNFFEELWALDEDSNTGEDTSGTKDFLDKCKKAEGQQVNQKSHSSSTSHSIRDLSRVVSNPPPSSAAIPRVLRHGELPLSSMSSTKERKNQQAKKTISEAGKVAQVRSIQPATKGKKRKRDDNIVLQPESRQIFKGLSFFFLPNDDVSLGRRIRIRRALEHGAQWVKEWDDSVTHVIMDDDQVYDNLLKHLKGDPVPSNVAVVSMMYSIDCISQQFALEPKQYLYWVKGAPNKPRPYANYVSPNKDLVLAEAKRRRFGVSSSYQTPSPNYSDVTMSTPFDSNTRSDLDGNHLQVTKSPSKSIFHRKDALAEAIDETKNLKHRPLDLDEGDTSRDLSEVSDVSDVSDEESVPKQKSALSNFSCMSKHDGKTDKTNPNARTIEVLQEMQGYYGQTRDQWRSIAYRKAISALKSRTHKITTSEEAFAIPNIGRRLADKIEEIVRTDKLQRLENAKLEPNDEVLERFLKIYGVGCNQALKWIHNGYRTLDDLSRKASLTENQKIGIERYEDFQTRIPRSEIDQHAQYLHERLKRVDSAIQLTIGGSYRRGAADSGDIDCILTKPGCRIEELRTIMLQRVIPELFKRDYLKVALIKSAKHDGGVWQGASCLSGQTMWRRIDFLFVPWDQMGAALIYFTGNDIFNRSIRLLASKKGMRLNQKGLWKDVMRDKNREKITQGSLVESKDEKKIFEILGVPWRPPEHRQC